MEQSITKCYILYDTIYLAFLKLQNHRDEEVISGLPGVRDGMARRRVHVAIEKGSKKELYGDGVVSIFTWW